MIEKTKIAMNSICELNATSVVTNNVFIILVKSFMSSISINIFIAKGKTE